MDYGPEPKSWEEGPSELRMNWSDGHASRHPYPELRGACPCAVCRDEKKPGRIRKAVPADVHPLQIGRVGRYAVTFVWSDGHQTGIYTYELLRELCGCADCRRAA